MHAPAVRPSRDRLSLLVLNFRREVRVLLASNDLKAEGAPVKRLTAISLTAACLFQSGCAELGALQDVLDDPMIRQVAALSLAGVTPARDFRESGNIDFSLFNEEGGGELLSFGQLQQSGMRVEVQNEDGTYSECEHTGGDEVTPKPFNTVTLLLDGSGSMELAYPPSEYGDVCVTCPHDPKRERIDAARGLVDRVFAASPDSEFAVAEFGPDPTVGFTATRLHAEFAVDPLAVQDAISQVRGDERVGTPLYDSLAEMVFETQAAAQSLEETVRRDRGEDVPWEEMGEDADVPVEMREVARTIVVLSDGEDNESEAWNVDSVIGLANDAGVRVYAIGLGPASASSANPDVVDPEQTQAVRNLQKLARDTGGFYAAARNPAQLRELYDVLGRAMTEGYQVETYSCVPKPTHETPRDECDVPPVGSRIDGRMSFGEVSIPWVTVAN